MSRVRRVPNLYIVGAPRSGTTTIYELLRRSPHVFARMKEPGTLAREDLLQFTAGPDDLATLPRPFDDYVRLFEGARERYAIDASTIYLWSQAAVRAIASLCDDPKIIICLRDPVERAFSNYQLHVALGQESLDFSGAVLEEPRRKAAGWSPRWWYTELSRYATSVQRYLDTFGRNQVHIIMYDDLSSAWARVVDGLQEFLGIDLSWGRSRPIHVNRAGTVRYGFLHRVLTQPTVLSGVPKRLLPENVWRRLRESLRFWEERWNIRPKRVGPCVRRWLMPRFESDIRDLEAVLRVDLRRWRVP